MIRVIVFTAFYLPGFKGGGPIRTVANMIESLGSEINFSLVTLDRDLGDNYEYPNVLPDTWQQVGKASVYYAAPRKFLFKAIKIIKNFQGAVLHLNSFFSFRFSILPLLITTYFKPNVKILIGPRGEFSEGALSIKPLKKHCFILAVKLFGLYKNVIWHASTLEEVLDIKRVMGISVDVLTAIDITLPEANLTLSPRIQGEPLRIVFISRISPKKNLLLAIEVLKMVKCKVDFHVYGPAEDKGYWNECQRARAALPPNISFNYHGPLLPNAVSQKFAEHDLFFLPTLGENFGHVIAEALSAGVPVLISDKTPWRNLKANALGWDLSLEQPESFASCIEICHAKSTNEYHLWRQHIRVWAQQNIGNEDAIEQNRQLFKSLKVSNEH